MDKITSAPVEQSDREFEQFICAACHDLRESLREIRLRAELGPGGDIEDQIRAMELLLDGMMEYSSVCAVENSHARVEMEGVLSQVLVQLDMQIQESAAVVTHDPLPAVMGDSSELATVLRHLLMNALKFHGGDSPRIHVSARAMRDQWEFSVRDNGPGIEAAYHERVFLPFRRLHGRSHAGNGLGLAICRRAIERHRGEIWVAPEPESGTTVSFTLPAAH